MELDSRPALQNGLPNASDAPQEVEGCHNHRISVRSRLLHLRANSCLLYHSFIGRNRFRKSFDELFHLFLFEISLTLFPTSWFKIFVLQHVPVLLADYMPHEIVLITFHCQQLSTSHNGFQQFHLALRLPLLLHLLPFVVLYFVLNNLVILKTYLLAVFWGLRTQFTSLLL